ncbi:hypothetical protein OG241_08205 [Streptomyces sp. NBC_01390]|uniref:hypothetical protein n=1 Tax=Streptomyces sp. NBC_01390 TaxID=2903850 RepID=UPI003248B6D3
MVVKSGLGKSAEQAICTTMALDRRNAPPISGWGGREATTLVRLGSGSWYDLATGLQAGSERVA